MAILDSRVIKWLSDQYKSEGIYGSAKAITMIILVAYLLPQMVIGIQRNDFLHALSFGMLSLCAIILLVGMIKESDERRIKKQKYKDDRKDAEWQREWDISQKEIHAAYREYLRNMQRNIMKSKYDHLNSYYAAKKDSLATSMMFQIRETLKESAIRAINSINSDQELSKKQMAEQLSKGIEDVLNILDGQICKEDGLMNAFDIDADELDNGVEIAINNGASGLSESDEEFKRKEEEKADG